MKRVVHGEFLQIAECTPTHRLTRHAESFRSRLFAFFRVLRKVCDEGDALREFSVAREVALDVPPSAHLLPKLSRSLFN
jgi:hypothetical protein